MKEYENIQPLADWAKNNYFSERHARRLAKLGKIKNCFKYKRSWYVGLGNKTVEGLGFDGHK